VTQTAGGSGLRGAGCNGPGVQRQQRVYGGVLAIGLAALSQAFLVNRSERAGIHAAGKAVASGLAHFALSCCAGQVLCPCSSFRGGDSVLPVAAVRQGRQSVRALPWSSGSWNAAELSSNSWVSIVTLATQATSHHSHSKCFDSSSQGLSEFPMTSPAVPVFSISSRANSS
jgi:hypothetical protein